MKIHPHAAFIAEALNNMDRKIEVYADDEWCPCVLKYVLNATHPNVGARWEFRFKPKQPAIVSTLTDGELSQVNVRGSMSGVEYRRAIANAACAAERKRIAELPAVSNITIFSGSYTHEKLGNLLNSAIAQFQRDLMEEKI